MSTSPETTTSFGVGDTFGCEYCRLTYGTDRTCPDCGNRDADSA